MTDEQKKEWHAKYIAFCKETGAQLVFSPKIVPVSKDGTVVKADVDLDVVEFKEE
jgi:hypothetical protein